MTNNKEYMEDKGDPLPESQQLIEDIKRDLQFDRKKHAKRFGTDKKLMAYTLSNAKDEKGRQLSARAIADKIGDVSHATVSKWIRKIREDGEIDGLELREAAEDLTDKLSNTCMIASTYYLQESLKPEKAEKASLLQLATASKLTAESGRLLKGQSTENISYVVKRINSVESEEKKIQEERDELERQIREIEKG